MVVLLISRYEGPKKLTLSPQNGGFFGHFGPFLNSLGLCGVDLLDKIKAFLDHLWKMASFVSDAIADKSHHYCSNLK